MTARAACARCAALRCPAISRPDVRRVVALALTLAAIAADARAQLVRRNPAAAWTPDSSVKAVLTGGSAQLTVAPPLPRDHQRRVGFGLVMEGG